jgi:hypothetical protein
VPAAPQPCCGEPLARCGEPLALCASRSYRWFVRNPLLYTTQPQVGTQQCSALSDQPACSDLPDAPRANRFLANNPGYLVNLDLSPNAPPAIPDDEHAVTKAPKFAHDWEPRYWPYFIYIGAASFPTRVSIPASRRAELERLVLRLRPTHQWVVMLVDYV